MLEQKGDLSAYKLKLSFELSSCVGGGHTHGDVDLIAATAPVTAPSRAPLRGTVFAAADFLAFPHGAAAALLWVGALDRGADFARVEAERLKDGAVGGHAIVQVHALGDGAAAALKGVGRCDGNARQLGAGARGIDGRTGRHLIGAAALGTAQGAAAVGGTTDVVFAAGPLHNPHFKLAVAAAARGRVVKLLRCGAVGDLKTKKVDGPPQCAPVLHRTTVATTKRRLYNGHRLVARACARRGRGTRDAAALVDGLVADATVCGAALTKGLVRERRNLGLQSTATVRGRVEAAVDCIHSGRRRALRRGVGRVVERAR